MKGRCHYKELHQSAIGTISICTRCQNLCIEIGHLVSLISQEPFQLILSDFKARQEFYDQQHVAKGQPEKVLICLNNDNLFLNLTPAEFDDLVELFEVANHMLQADKLINA